MVATIKLQSMNRSANLSEVCVRDLEAAVVVCGGVQTRNWLCVSVIGYVHRGKANDNRVTTNYENNHDTTQKCVSQSAVALCVKCIFAYSPLFPFCSFGFAITLIGTQRPD